MIVVLVIARVRVIKVVRIRFIQNFWEGVSGVGVGGRIVSSRSEVGVGVSFKGSFG